MLILITMQIYIFTTKFFYHKYIYGVKIFKYYYKLNFHGKKNYFAPKLNYYL